MYIYNSLSIYTQVKKMDIWDNSLYIYSYIKPCDGGWGEEEKTPPRVLENPTQALSIHNIPFFNQLFSLCEYRHNTAFYNSEKTGYLGYLYLHKSQGWHL